MAKKQLDKTLEEELRDAMLASGMTNREIGRLSDVDNGLIGRFVTGKRTLTLPTAGRIVRALGLELTKRKSDCRDE